MVPLVDAWRRRVDIDSGARVRLQCGAAGCGRFFGKLTIALDYLDCFFALEFRPLVECRRTAWGDRSEPQDTFRCSCGAAYRVRESTTVRAIMRAIESGDRSLWLGVDL
jgi:hypothetical protein